MKKLYFFVAIGIVLVAISFAGCGSDYFEVDTQILQQKIYDPTVIKYEGLQSSTVLYLDHSTCVIDARQNSRVFNALSPQLGQYSDTLRLIRGEAVKTIALNRSDNKVFEILQTIQCDIPYTNILKAVEQICNDNQQAILITDFELIRQNEPVHDQDPYLSEPFKNWIKKGNSIYIVVETYQERYNGNNYSKKRFYLFFTDDNLDAPISDNMLNQIDPMIKDGSCKLFKLTNSDISVKREGNNMVADDLTSTVEDKNGFEFVSIDDSWDDIREYVMKLDKYGELLAEEEPVPLIKNLVFNDGENYIINDIEIVATDITARYLAVEDSIISPNDIDISEGFKLDKNALKEHKFNMLLTDKIFKLLPDEFGGNLIRLDFVITQVSLQNFDEGIFKWQSLYNGDSAICVSLSIDNVLRDIEIVPTSRDRKIIHTVFIKTESF